MDKGGYETNDSRAIGTMDQDGEFHNAKFQVKLGYGNREVQPPTIFCKIRIKIIYILHFP
jgi:hypothetical protein